MRTRVLTAITVALTATATFSAHASPVSTGTTTRVSPTPTNGLAGDSTYGSVSADGRWVAFDTNSALDAADVNGGTDIYLRDMSTGSVRLVSLGTAGMRAFHPAITPDARAIAYMVRGSGQGLHVWYRETRVDTLVAPVKGLDAGISPNGRWATANVGSRFALADLDAKTYAMLPGDMAALADDRVAFMHPWSLGPADTDDSWDVYLREHATGALTLITGDTDAFAFNPALSPDGTHLAFEMASDLDVHPVRLVLQDLHTGARRLVTDDAEPYATPSVSSGGAVVAFASPGAFGSPQDPRATQPLAVPGVYVWDASSGATTLVSVRDDLLPSAWAAPAASQDFCLVLESIPVCAPFPAVLLGANANNPHVSSGGEWIVFDTLQRLDASDTNDSHDVYVHKRVAPSR